ncbi:hypothetical protein [Halalkalibacter urbisdiaboli]|uniref:hypothetical protein n=1 Tax=Halalkalibacter urbisdiaboli TaxID=1960589 RepID=UPI000B44EEA6|nr:hypothetical protein [Halalkalibacter urbisdiaboli]
MLSFIINKLFVYSLVAFILLYFLSTVWNLTLLGEFISGAGLLMLLSIFFVSSKRSMILPVCLITVSIVILGVTSSSPVVLWIGLREMSSIIPLVILFSLVSWIIGDRPYVKALLICGKQYITTPTRFYTLVAALSHFVSSFMTVGGIPFVYHMFRNAKKESAVKEAWDFTLSSAIMRGFTLTVLWTAVHPAFAYVIAGTNAPLLPTMVKGFGLACVGFILCVIMYRLQLNRKQITFEVIPDLSARSDESLDGLVGKFLFWVALLMGGILAMTQWLNINILLSAPVIIVVITTLYFVSNRNVAQYKRLWIRLVTEDLGKKKKEMLLIFLQAF